MSPNSINFTVYLILNYIVFEMSWMNTFWVWVWVWVYLNQICIVKMWKIFEIFGGHQHIISSMHGWTKVVCYLIMPLGVGLKPIED